MMNNVMFVGRLVKDVELKKDEKGIDYAIITIACPRNYKNEEGVYDTDFINAIIKDNMAKNANEYCFKGDLIGIRGRLETNKDNTYIINCEKLTFLSRKNNEEE